jgi:hypothetical protein
LFLNNVKEIQYEISGSDSKLDGKGLYMLDRKKEDNYYKITALGDNEDDNNYFLFSRPLDNTNRTVDIVFSIKENDKNVSFQRIKTNYVSVYFPTEIESKLDFIVQAPFEVIPTRTDLEKNSERNKNLIKCLAELLKDIILKAKDKNWISLEFLNLLPFSMPDVDFPFKSLYQYLYDITIGIFNNEEILPITNFGEYVGKSYARIARGGIREGGIVEMFTNNELELLIGQGVRWMPIKTEKDNFTENDNVLGKLYKFLRDVIRVKEIGNDDIPSLLEKNPKFIKNFSNNKEWLIKFYNYLAEKRREDLGKKQKYSQIPFVQTTKGDFVSSYNDISPNIFQKPKKALIELENLNFIAEFIQKNCSEFVDLMRIPIPDDYDYFIKELEKIYNEKEIDEDQHLKQIERALGYITENKSGAIDYFKKYLFLNCIKTDGKEELITCSDGNIFFLNDPKGISIFDYFIDTICNVYILNEDYYIEKGIERDKLCRLKSIGVKDSDCIINKGRDSYFRNGYSSQNRGVFKKELVFLYIDNVVMSIDRNSNSTNSKKKSLVIFKLLLTVEKHLKGEWQYGMKDPDIIYDVSDIIHLLETRKWLYKTNGELVKSSEITRYELDSNIYGEIDKKSDIYDILNFKKTEQDKNEEIIFSLINQYGEQVIEKLIEQLIPKDNEEFDPDVDVQSHIFPEDDIKDLKQLQEEIRNSYNIAPSVKYEYVLRSIRTSRGKDKEHLRFRYRGHCQICQCPNNDWEVAEIFKNPIKEMVEMNLSLCPNCASQYRRLRNNDEIMSVFADKIRNISPEEKTTIQLEPNKDIHFTQTHLAEIQEILKLELKDEKAINNPPTQPL